MFKQGPGDSRADTATLADALERHEKAALAPAEPRIAVDGRYAFAFATASLLANRDLTTAHRLLRFELGME